ncbi:sensor histidine kinase [Paenibacillus medicaginis]|uniref:histidine kinase n=1 Tax=Paenibacillus medicaginis TaxID=1470560 RepID=A0ABV5C3H7_9BACL
MRMLFIFSFISIITIITLSYIVFRSIADATIRRELEVQKAAMESVDGYIRQQYEAVQDMVSDLHRNEALSANTSYFMEHTYADYVQHLTEGFYTNRDDYSTDTQTHFQNLVEEHANIRHVLLYSAEQQYLSNFSRNMEFKQRHENTAHSFVPDVMAMETPNISAPNYWVRKTIDEWDPALYAIRVPINNKQTLKNVGQFMVFLDSQSIGQALANYKNSLKGDIVVLSAQGTVLFDSSGQYYGRSYPYVNVENALFDSTGAGVMNKVQDRYVNQLISADEGYVVIGSVPKSDIAGAYAAIRNTIVLFSLLCLLFAILVPAFFIMNFAKRTRRIIRFMHKVKEGDLTARIHDTREDELGQIASSFNDMLVEMNQYIDRVYKAEIRQKETELVALQARINPHFLYNTLEVIRMRAVSQGARDVGDMIYSLSVLFKSQVQQKSNHTLKDELEACRLYLELFRIRYKDIFIYKIKVDSRFYACPAVKLSLQPLVENYVIHGIRTERTDNKLEIEVMEENGVLMIEVRDNGKGITADRLDEIRQELACQEESGRMFGLRSVHSRLRFLYGPDYGITIDSKPDEGTTIQVRYPVEERTDA